MTGPVQPQGIPPAPPLRPDEISGAAAAPGVLPRHYLGARIPLVFLILINIVLGLAAYPIILGLSVMVGYTTDQYHDLTQGFILFTIPPSALHLLALCNVGITRRGSFYLVLSVVSVAVQVIALLASRGLYEWCIAPVIAGLAVSAAVGGRPKEDAERIALLEHSPWRLILDAVIAVSTTVLLVVLIHLNNEAAAPENRHPPRDFDSSEARERLDETLDPLLAALSAVEGMPEPRMDGGGLEACEDGSQDDPDWSAAERQYTFNDPDSAEGLSPETGERAIEAVEASLTDNGLEFTAERRDLWGYELSATRDDGIRIWFRLNSEGASLWAGTGCVRNADTL